MNYLHEKYCPGYAEIPPSTSRITPDWDGMESVLTSNKRKHKCIKKLLKFSDTFYFPASFIISPRLSFKQPLKSELVQWNFNPRVKDLNQEIYIETYKHRHIFKKLCISYKDQMKRTCSCQTLNYSPGQNIRQKVKKSHKI